MFNKVIKQIFSSQNYLRSLSLFFIFIGINCNSIFAQDSVKVKKPLLVGLGVEAYFSMSGHGGFYSAYLSFNKGRGTFKAGPVMHKRSQQISGAKLCYSYRIASLNGEDIYNMPFNELRVGAVQVNLFLFAQYVESATLSYKRSVETQLLNIDSTTVNMDWNAVKLNTFEGGIGLEMGIKITRRMLLTGYIGLSIYDHLNYFPELYYDKTAAVLMAGTSLGIPTFRLKRKPNKS